MQKISISVAIITLNEADRLPRCLKSIEFADEVIVVDSGSHDNTLDIAEQWGCAVYSHPFSSFSRQKQFAVDQCKHQWVLLMDADERIPTETADAIRRIVTSCPGDVAAYGFRRKNYFHHRWIRHCGWWPDRVIRLFRRDIGSFSTNSVHERWVAQGTIKQLNNDIEHFSYRNYTEMIDKLQRYSTLAARDLANGSPQLSALTPVTHGAWMFVKTYLFELGVLCGFDGIIISLLNAGGSFMKYAKCREILLYGTPDENLKNTTR